MIALARSLHDKVSQRVTARRVDEVECVLAVLLATAIAVRLGTPSVSWAAFAAYTVMRGHVAETLARGGLRILGTVAGGLLASALVPLVGRSPASAAAVQLVVVGTTLYWALVGRRAYAWLFVGLTFAMAFLDTRGTSAPVGAFVRTRWAETGLGTLACVLISLASTVTLRRWWPAPPARIATVDRWHPSAARHALQGAIAAALLTAATFFVPVPAPAQGAVTIMAAMLLPVSSIGVSGLVPVSRRVLHRAVGCLAGAGFGLPFLLVAHGWAPLLVLGTVTGVVLGRHIENGAGRYGYMGTQFTLAVLAVLVPDSYSAATIQPGLHRLYGILSGALILEAVLLAWHFAAPASRTSPLPRESSPEGEARPERTPCSKPDI